MWKKDIRGSNYYFFFATAFTANPLFTWFKSCFITYPFEAHIPFFPFSASFLTLPPSICMPCSLCSRTKITDTASVTESQMSGSHLWRKQTEHIAFLGLRWLIQQEKWQLIAVNPHAAVHLQWRCEQGFVCSSGFLLSAIGSCKVTTLWPRDRLA